MQRFIIVFCICLATSIYGNKQKKRLFSIFSMLCFVSSFQALTDDERAKFRAEVLDRHNAVRKQYCAKTLERNTTLEQQAQKYCDDMAKSGNFAHSNRTDAGENSYQHTPFDYTKNNGRSWLVAFNFDRFCLGATPVDYWAAEGANYTSTKPVPTELHFTQIVWKATTSLGVGLCVIPNNGLMVVANYYPRGNYEGQFAANVGCSNQ